MFGRLPVQCATQFADIYRQNGDLSPLVAEKSGCLSRDLLGRCKRVLTAMQATFPQLRDADATLVAETVLAYESVFGSLHRQVATHINDIRFVALRPKETECCGMPVEVAEQTPRGRAPADLPDGVHLIGLDSEGAIPLVNILAFQVIHSTLVARDRCHFWNALSS